MLEKLASEAHSVIIAMQNNLWFCFKIITLLWVIQIINFLGKYSFNSFGIRTRELRGLPGIIFSPFLHANFNHLFFNTIPLFVLADLVLLNGKPAFYYVTYSIIILSGLLVWMLGRKGTHIGASSLIMGYFGFLLARAYFNVTGTAVILAAVCLYYFGGLVLSLFPGAKKNVSWEGHVFGAASGIFAAYYLSAIMKAKLLPNWLIF